MSETDNKTKNKAEIKTTETAPYMKKDKQQNNQTETPKSIMLAPLVLLLVTVIVIAVTFYENEYKVAQAGLMTDSFGSTANTGVSTNKETVLAEQVSEKPAAEPAAVKRVSATTDKQANVTEVSSQAVKTTSIDVSKAAEPASDQMPGESRNAPSQRQAYANRQAYEQARKEAKARMLEQREKHHKEMQQRRQAYKKEMQAKRVQYEATLKTYQEKRAKIAEKQKAINQQIEQNRIETIQKMKQMHKEISDMQKQMRQMMRDSQQQVKNNDTTPKQGS